MAVAICGFSTSHLWSRAFLVPLAVFRPFPYPSYPISGSQTFPARYILLILYHFAHSLNLLILAVSHTVSI